MLCPERSEGQTYRSAIGCNVLFIKWIFYPERSSWYIYLFALLVLIRVIRVFLRVFHLLYCAAIQ